MISNGARRRSCVVQCSGKPEPRSYDYRKVIRLSCCAVFLCAALTGCRSVSDHRKRADSFAEGVITAAQSNEIGRIEIIEIEPPAETLRRRLIRTQNLKHNDPASLGIHALRNDEYWQKDRHLTGAVTNEVRLSGGESISLGLVDSLQVAAGNSPEFQKAKESLYRAALALDLEQEKFRNTFQSMLTGDYEFEFSEDEDVGFAAHSGEFGISRKFMTGVELSSSLVIDIAQLLTQERDSVFGIAVDGGITVPLMRGSGRKIVGEPLKQSRRNLLYAVRNFERFKRTFAVGIAESFLGTLEQYQQAQYVRENYSRLQAASRRAKRLADSGRLPGFQYDQAVQDELRARARWITARQRYSRNLDEFKVKLGIPPDAGIKIDADELDNLTAVTNRIDFAINSGPGGENKPAVLTLGDNSIQRVNGLTYPEAITIALDSRLDLKTAADFVGDAQRKVYVAQDRLRGELTLLGRASTGERRNSSASVESGDVQLDSDEGSSGGLLTIDLPLERAEERNAYRNAIIDLQENVRDYQALEDRVKLDVINALRDLVEAKETVAIQAKAVKLAEKRVASTDMLLQAGRAAVRDVLEAEESLLSVQNALTTAIVNYRTAEWRLQRDMGVLEVSEKGIWKEYEAKRNDQQ